MSYNEKAVPFLRNATRTCIAPTGTIAILAGVSSGIEPHFSGEWERKTHEGIILNESALKVEGFTPKTAMEIDWRWHILHQAAFQRHTDLAVSKTINMVYDAYVCAWEQGLKGVTIFRDGSRGGQVLTTTITGKDAQPSNDLGAVPELDSNPGSNGTEPNGHRVSPTGYPSETRSRLPKTREALTHKFSIDGQDVYFTVGLYENGQPGELFIKASKEGSTISGLLDGIGIAISLGLQHGVPMSVYARKYAGVNFEPHGLTDNPDLRTATSILDYIFRWLGHRFNGHYDNPVGVTYDIVDMSPLYNSGKHDDLEVIPLGNFCPECEAPTVMAEGCQHCTKCDWSRC
jgi:ribonucleoside-diphosphate reductase alpha chain